MSTNTPILFISPSKIKVSGEDPAYGWNNSNLEEILLEIKSKINGKSVRILFDDSVCYLVNFSLNEGQHPHRWEILETIQAQIPQKIESGFWDYKIDQFGKLSRVQAFVIKKEFLVSLAKGLMDADLHLEASEPIALAIARLTKQELEPHIVVYSFSKEENYSYILANKGEVLSLITSSEEVNPDQLERFVNFCKQRYSITPAKILLDTSILPDQREISKIPIGHVSLNPFKGILEKKDIKGPDDKVLNLDSEKLLKPVVMSEPLAPDPNSKPQNTKKIPLIIPAGVVAALIGFVGFLILTPNESEPSPSPTPVSFVTPAPQINLNDYKFQILNGTGVAGEAANVRNLLGIDSADLGNASSYDYEFTEIKIKQGLPDTVFDFISKDLSDTYEIKHSAQDLTEESGFDVVIITGVKK